MMHAHHPLERFSPPRAPEALRTRVLAAARAASVASARPSRADRIWFSTGWRLAWMTAMAVLVLTEIALSHTPPSAPKTERESVAAAAALGLPDGTWIGAEIASFDGAPLDAAQEAL